MNINLAINYLNQAKIHLHEFKQHKESIDNIINSLKKTKIKLKEQELEKGKINNINLIINSANPKLTVELIDQLLDDKIIH